MWFGCEVMKPIRAISGTSSWMRRSRSGQRRPVVEVEPVGVDPLAEQRDLEDAVLREPLHLVDDVAHRTAPLAALRERDDAEGAELVAPAHDRDEGLVLPAARAARSRSKVISFSSTASTRWPCADLVEELRDVLEAVGAHDEVDVRRPLEDEVLVVLGHAAHDADDRRRAARA